MTDYIFEVPFNFTITAETPEKALEMARHFLEVQSEVSIGLPAPAKFAGFAVAAHELEPRHLVYAYPASDAEGVKDTL